MNPNAEKVKASAEDSRSAFSMQSALVSASESVTLLVTPSEKASVSKLVLPLEKPSVLDEVIESVLVSEIRWVMESESELDHLSSDNRHRYLCPYDNPGGIHPSLNPLLGNIANARGRYKGERNRTPDSRLP
jgi:hypothetical protein